MHTRKRATPQTQMFFRRFLAAGLAALVLALGMLSVAPAAHKHLHDDADHEDHECAIVFLAHGVTLSSAITAPPATESAWQETFFAVPGALYLVRPKYLLPLKCGPPARA